MEPFHSGPLSGENDDATQVTDGNSDNRMSSSPTQRRLALGAAGVTSIVGLAIAAAAALERGGTLLDQTLIVAIACVLVLGAHLLPSLSRSPLARLLWLGCLMLTAWGHATFFTAASHRAGSVRADAVATTSRAEALRAELQAIQARPLAVVSAELAATQVRANTAATAVERCQRTVSSEQICLRLSAAAEATRLRATALADEMSESRRAADLRNRLAEAASEQDAERQAAAADPIARSIADLMGLPAEVLSTGVSVLSAIVIELMAALLWSIGLQSGTAPRPASALERWPSFGPKKTVVSPTAATLQAGVARLRRLILRWKGQVRGRPRHNPTDPIAGAADDSVPLLNRIRPSGRGQGVRRRSRLSTTAVATETG